MLALDICTIKVVLFLLGARIRRNRLSSTRTELSCVLLRALVALKNPVHVCRLQGFTLVVRIETVLLTPSKIVKIKLCSTETKCWHHNI